MLNFSEVYIQEHHEQLSFNKNAQYKMVTENSQIFHHKQY